MANDYSDIGLTTRFTKDSSLPERRRASGDIDNLVFDARYDAQASRINASKANLGEFVKIATSASATADFSSAQELNLTSTLTFNTPNVDTLVYATPYISLYQGDTTASGSQIFPLRGASVTSGRYDVGHSFNHETWNGTQANWAGHIVDTDGTSTQIVNLVVQWAYLDYKSHDAS